MNSNIELSIIITCYNDAKIIPLLIDEIRFNTDKLNVEYEIILVNDSSPDNSESVIKEICSNNKRVKGITLSRNYGQQIAMSAGMKNSIGNYVIIMDGDLQNPPSEIPNLYNEIKNGYDIVYTVSKIRNNIFNETTSILFWFLISTIFNVKIIKNQLMYKIMTSEIAKKYNMYGEVNRTVAGIVQDITDNYKIITIKNQKRKIGKSNYSFIKRFNLMIDIIISLTSSPLNIMLHLGWITLLFTIIVTFYHLFIYLFYDVPAGYTSIVLTIFFFGSLIILLLGFIGKFLANIYSEVRNRPLYYIRERFNFKEVQNEK